jgi:nitrate reductase assembly molybdenum cofactor insertion protein NarJ
MNYAIADLWAHLIEAEAIAESLEGEEYEALTEIVGHAAELADMALATEE